VTADGSLFYLAVALASFFRVRFNGPTSTFGEVAGRVTRSNDGTGISGVAVQLTGTQTRKTITDSNGNYRFDNVQTSGIYTVTPRRANFSFNPTERSLSQLGNNTDAPFNGVYAGTTNNPLDTPEYLCGNIIWISLVVSPTKVGSTSGAIR